MDIFSLPSGNEEYSMEIKDGKVTHKSSYDLQLSLPSKHYIIMVSCLKHFLEMSLLTLASLHLQHFRKQFWT